MIRLPNSLKQGDLVQIIAPSDVPTKNSQDIADIKATFKSLGLEVNFSSNCFNANATKKDKLQDLHSAFADPEVKAVFAATGGFSANNLIDDINYSDIKRSPKIFCGYSDITILLNAVNSKTGLITYHGPNAGGVASPHGQKYTLDYLNRCLFSRKVFNIEFSKQWFNKDYSVAKPRYSSHKNDGWWPLNKKGIVEGRLVGGNISCLLLLAGTEYFPNLKKAIIFIEDDYETQSHHFAAKFKCLTQQPGFDKVEGIIIGRFQPRSNIKRTFIEDLVVQDSRLEDMPVLANVDFGHTKPQVTLPIGGIAQLKVLPNSSAIKIIEH